MVKVERPEEGRAVSLSPHLGQGAVERPQPAQRTASAPSTAAAPAAPPVQPRPAATHVEERAVGQPGRMVIEGEGKRIEVQPGGALVKTTVGSSIGREAEELVGSSGNAVSRLADKLGIQKTPQGQPPQSQGQPPSNLPKQGQAFHNKAPPPIPPNAPDYVKELVGDLAKNGVEVLSVEGGPVSEAGQQTWTIKALGPDGQAHTISIRNVVGSPASSKYIVSSDVSKYEYGVDSGGEAAAQFLSELVAKGTPPPAPQGVPQNLPDYVKRTIDFLKSDRGLSAASVQNLGGDTWRIVVQRADGSTADILLSPGSMGIYEGGKLLGGYTWSGGWSNFDPKVAFYTSSAGALRNVNPTLDQLLSQYRGQGELAALLYSIVNDPNAFADASLRLGAKIASVDYAAGVVRLADGRTLQASIKDGVLYIGDTPVAKVPDKMEQSAVLAGAAVAYGQKILSNIDSYLKSAQTNAFGLKLFEAEGHRWLYDPTSGRLYLADSMTAQEFWRTGPVGLGSLGLPEVGAYGTSGARFLGLNASGKLIQLPPNPAARLDVLLDAFLTIENKLKEAGIPYIVKDGKLYMVVPPDKGTETLTLSDGSKVGLVPVLSHAATMDTAMSLAARDLDSMYEHAASLTVKDLLRSYLSTLGVQPTDDPAAFARSSYKSGNTSVEVFYAAPPKIPPPNPQMLDTWAKMVYGYNTDVQKVGDNMWILTVKDMADRRKAKLEVQYDPNTGKWTFKPLTGTIEITYPLNGVGGLVENYMGKGPAKVGVWGTATSTFEVPLDQTTFSGTFYIVNNVHTTPNDVEITNGDLYIQLPNGAFYKLEGGKWTPTAPYIPGETNLAPAETAPKPAQQPQAMPPPDYLLMHQAMPPPDYLLMQKGVNVIKLANGQAITISPDITPNATQIFDISKLSQQVERSMAGGQIPPVAVAWTADGRAYIWYKGSDKPVEVKPGPGGSPVATWVQDGVEYGLFLLPPGSSYAFAGKSGNAQVVENLTSTGAPIVMVRTADGWMPIADPAGNINESALQQAAQYYSKSVESLKPQWQQIMDQFAAGLASTPLGAMGKTLGKLAGAGLASLATGKPFGETYAKGQQAVQQIELAAQGTPLYTAGQVVGWGTAAAGAVLGGVSLASEAASAGSLSGAASVLARNLVPSAAISGALAAAGGGSPEDVVKSALLGMALAPAMGGIGPKAALAAAGAGAGAGALTYLATGSPQMALGAGADVGFLSLMAGGLAGLGKGEVNISRDEIEAVAKAAGRPVRDITDLIKKAVERAGGTAEEAPGGGLRVVLEADKAARALAKEAVDYAAPPGKAYDVYFSIMRQASAGAKVDPYRAALDAGLPEADAAKFAEAYKAYLSTLAQNIPSLKDRLAALGGEEAAGTRTSIGEEVRKVVTSAVDAARTAASQILGSIKAAGGAVEGAVVRPAAKIAEEVGESLASPRQGGEQSQIDVRVMRWLARNVDEPLQRGNFGFAVDKALDVVRAVDRIRELESKGSLSEREARELDELRLKAALNRYYKIYDALRELRPSVFEAARARLAEERLADALRELGGREALDKLRSVLTPEELESLAKNAGKVGRDVLAKAALGDRDALDRLAGELGVARDKIEYIAKMWAASHLQDVVEAMDAADAKELLSDRARLAEAARAFGVKEEDLQAMLEEALERKARALARGGAGEARPPEARPPAGGEARTGEEGGAEKRVGEEGGGKEVRTKEGQVLLLKEEEAGRSEAKEEAKERGGVRTREEGGQVLLVEERPKLEVKEEGRLLKEEGRLLRIPERAPLAERIGEELRRRWLLGVPYALQPGYGPGPAFAPPQLVPVSAPGYAAVPTYTPYYTPITPAGTGSVQTPSTTETTQISTTQTPSTTPETSPELTTPGTSPQQIPQQAPIPMVAPVPTPQQTPIGEAPPPITVGGWPWYPAEGGWGRRYRPGRQGERLVL
jgi:hypothetical protein